MDYAALKTLHMATVAITLTLFILRGAWMAMGSLHLGARWTRILPHLNDTVLLASGIALAWTLGLSPLEHGWLAAKLVALVAYIVLGTIALKRGKTRGQRITAGTAALLVFGYMLAVAHTHNPLPGLG
ncbi:MAG: regulator SirB [Thiobacillus sp. 65-69]|nr:SirB2 family protein [Thiobacillus sp.]ODU89801.1 MAG: regulator SirB [Thiobacillus sp. SCN 65-179]OJW37729.1 MAG: regulator SirB [Thiobacillus sp. 65-69]